MDEQPLQPLWICIMYSRYVVETTIWGLGLGTYDLLASWVNENAWSVDYGWETRNLYAISMQVVPESMQIMQCITHSPCSTIDWLAS